MARENSKSYHPLLPKCHEGSANKISSFNAAGSWDFRKKVEFDNLSKSLKVEKIDPYYFQIDSIPDVWARPILFEMALFDKNHVLHQRILGEWRGMMAVLGLREIKNITDLVSKPVSIPRKIEKPKSSQESPNFIEVLSKLAPAKSLSDDTSWYELFVLLLRGKPIAITSPTTLVCTATDCLNRLTGIPWTDGRFLLDPVADKDPQGQLTEGQKQSLASWLEQLKDSLGRHEGLRSGIMEWNSILGLLDSFIANLGGIPDEKKELSPSGIGLNRWLFEHLDKPVKAVQVPLEKSDVLLKSSPGHEAAKKILLVDRNIAAQWKKLPQAISVAGTLTLDTAIPFSGLSGSRDRLGGKSLGDLEWRTPEDFFTDRFVLIREANAFPGAKRIPGSDSITSQGKGASPILPLRKEILDYLSSSDLYKRVKYSQNSEGISLSITFPLAGGEFEFNKSYEKESIVVLEASSLPVFEVWPDFVSDGWKEYYVFSGGIERPNGIRILPIISLGSKSATDRLEDLMVKLDLTKSETFPTAASVFLDESLIHSGLLLLSDPRKITETERKKSFRIGVDFGTTNTTVYLREGENDPTPAVFRGRFLSVTRAGNRDFLLPNYFLPLDDIKMPFLTIAKDYAKGKPIDELEILLDGHIFFYTPDPKYDPRNFHVNLKWGTKEERVWTRLFLQQLCLQCAAEAVASGAKEASWRFSFPTAFSIADEIDFTNIWSQIHQSITGKTGLKCLETSPIKKTESVAVAYYFSNPPTPHIKALPVKGIVCIDIGGGTSDVSIWQNNTLCHQSSLRFAGRTMFLAPLRKKPDFFKTFGIDADLSEFCNDEAAFYSKGDALLKSEGLRMLEKLPVLKSEQLVRDFLQLVAVGIGGLVYYIGLVLRSLEEQRKYKAQMPGLYFAGNGSRLLDWLAGGRFSNESPLKSFVRELLSNASQFSDDFADIHLSEDPKLEVAYGLVNDKTTLRIPEGPSRQEDHFVAGEGARGSGSDLSWNTFLTTSQLRAGIQTSKRLAKFEEFLEVFQSNARGVGLEKLSLGSRDTTRVKDSLDQELANIRSTDEKQIRVEPLFLMALRIFLEFKSQEWADKHTSPKA